jgi:hypothetical protein
MYRLTLVGALFLLLAPIRLLASDEGTDSPKVAGSGAPTMRIENVRMVGDTVWRPSCSDCTGCMFPGENALISFDLVNRGDSEVVASQLEGRVVLQGWIEPVETLSVSCGMPSRPQVEKRTPAGGFRVGSFPRLPPAIKPGSSVSFEHELYPIAEYCLHGRYAYYLLLQDEDGHVRDESRIDIEATCGYYDRCTVRQLQEPAPKQP